MSHKEEPKPTSFEKRLMRAMGLSCLRDLDQLFAAPISEYAALHSEPPDEEYALAEEMDQECDRQTEAQARYGWLFKNRYPN